MRGGDGGGEGVGGEDCGECFCVGDFGGWVVFSRRV